MVTGDLAKGCIELANQDVCFVCNMLIRDELTRERNRYNGAKLKKDVQADKPRYVTNVQGLFMFWVFVRWKWICRFGCVQ